MEILEGWNGATEVSFAGQIKADGYAPDAASAIDLAKGLLEK